MAAKTCVFEDIPQEYAGLGGRALTSTIVAREVDPTCTPLGPTTSSSLRRACWRDQQPQRNRISVGCKSPLTEGIKESNAGGQPGGHLARLGILAIIVEDMAKEGEWWQLVIGQDSARLVPSTVAGCNNFAAVEKLVETYGKECSYITIGRAGEYRLTAAASPAPTVNCGPCAMPGAAGSARSWAPRASRPSSSILRAAVIIRWWTRTGFRDAASASPRRWPGIPSRARALRIRHRRAGEHPA